MGVQGGSKPRTVFFLDLREDDLYFGVTSLMHLLEQECNAESVPAVFLANWCRQQSRLGNLHPLHPHILTKLENRLVLCCE